MFITDIINPQELQGYIRGLAYEQNLYRFTLSSFLPERQINDTEFRIVKGNLLDEDAATYRSFDAESPIAKRQGSTRISGQIPPLSRKIRLGEEERLRLNALQSGDQAELINAIYDDAAKMTRSLLARLELARGSALANGTLVLSENGVAATIDYGRASAHSVAPATLWSDLTNADPISDLHTWQQTYLTTNGVLPGAVLLSSSIINNMLRNTKVRTLAGSLAGVPSLLSPAALGQVFTTFGLPPLVPYDTVVRVDGVQTRPIPTNKLIFMPPNDEPLGSTLFGITAEALELVNSGYLLQQEASGIVAVIDKTSDPVATWTKAAALSLPVLANPNLTLVATVQ